MTTLEHVRIAFDGDSVPEKNIALRWAAVEIERLQAEIEDWRGKLATQCGKTLAAHVVLERIAAAHPLTPKAEFMREAARVLEQAP